jgi:sterol desaturase/sphingolipid hydroxylase (fatty acid hydroxylase superfamily)
MAWGAQEHDATSMSIPQTGLTGEFARLVVWLALLCAIFLPLERLASVRPQRVLRREFATDLVWYFVNGLVAGLILGVPVAALATWSRKLMPSGFLEWTGNLPIWVRVVAGFVVGDLGYYLYHRICHHVPWLWRFHAVHHSAQDMDFLVNTRAHPLDLVAGRLAGLVPLYLLGLAGPVGAKGTWVPIIIGLFGNFWGFFIHSNLRVRLGPIEWLLSTPSFHHWHHTQRGPINRNFAAMVPGLDRLFGTHHNPPGQWPDSYGIEESMPDDVGGQLLDPFGSRKRTNAEPSTAS